MTIGVRGEDLPDPSNNIEDAGAVNVMYGTPILGLNQARNQIWHQDSPVNIEDEAEKIDSFGNSLAAGDFNKDGADDLVIGVADEDFGSIEDAGAVNLIFGSTGSGLTASNNQIWHQDSN